VNALELRFYAIHLRAQVRESAELGHNPLEFNREQDYHYFNLCSSFGRSKALNKDGLDPEQNLP
jgi:hypothetical protein